MTPLLWSAIAYVLGAFALVLLALRAKNTALPPSLRSLEDAEQMRAVRPRPVQRRMEPDPHATLT